MSDYTDRLYTTRDEAVQREILEVIEVGEAKRDQYDVEAIADDVLTTQGEGADYRYLVGVDEDAFWASVSRHTFPVTASHEGNTAMETQTQTLTWTDPWGDETRLTVEWTTKEVRDPDGRRVTLWEECPLSLLTDPTTSTTPEVVPFYVQLSGWNGQDVYEPNECRTGRRLRAGEWRAVAATADGQPISPDQITGVHRRILIDTERLAREDALSEVVLANQDRVEADDALHEAVRAAVAAGATKTATAQAAGVTRKTLDAWLA